MMKRMKSFFSLYTLLAVLMLAIPEARAQGGQRLENMRIAYLTQDLELTSAQAEKFWPLFNEFAAKRKALHQALRAGMEKANSESASEADIYAAVDEVIAQRKREVELTQEYLPKFKKILTARQLGKLISIEKRMAKEFFRRRAGGHGGPPDGGTE